MEIKKEGQKIIDEDANYLLIMTGMEFSDLMHDLERARIHNVRTYNGDKLFKMLKEKGFTLTYDENEIIK